jgi:molybdopterin-containing oxidoreductase family iron-sulfur binding subunit
MRIDRRKFLKLAGLTGIGLGLSGTNIFLKEIVGASTTLLHSGSKTSTRLAMVIDVGKFESDEDYQRIIDACHSIYNVPTLIPEKGDPKHEVKWIWTDTFDHSFPEQKNEYHPLSIKEKMFPLLCNHCEHPPCVRVCPTKATFKRADGIVMQDPHRCIGCRFCMAACPYGSRSFNWVDPRPYIKERNPNYPTRTKGVVEKCTFCVERLAKGLIPACVEASNGALVFGDLQDPDSEVREILRSHYTIRRKPELGTQPSVYYVIGG